MQVNGAEFQSYVTWEDATFQVAALFPMTDISLMVFYNLDRRFSFTRCKMIGVKNKAPKTTTPPHSRQINHAASVIYIFCCFFR